MLAKDRRPAKNQDGGRFSQHHHSAECGCLRFCRVCAPRDAVCDGPLLKCPNSLRVAVMGTNNFSRPRAPLAELVSPVRTRLEAESPSIRAFWLLPRARRLSSADCTVHNYCPLLG